MASFSNLTSQDRAKIDQKLADLRAKTGSVWECFVMRPPQGGNQPCLLEITIDGRSAKPIILKEDGTNPADRLCYELENHALGFAAATKKCLFDPCDCQLQAGKPYCSQDRQDAATQGVERNFCQCAHGNCSSVSRSEPTQPTLATAATAGSITIDYTDRDNLVAQLMDLAAILIEQKTPSAKLPSRRRAAAETSKAVKHSKSARGR